MKWRILIQAVIVILLTGCASVNPRNVIPPELVDEVQIPGIPNARFWGDDVSPELEDRMKTMTRAEIYEEVPALAGQAHNYLAISGGGAEGAFGAGLLVGWSEAGSRPDFQMVTGISTGAIIAPWVFLGSEFDHVLRKIYTTTSTDDLLRYRAWIEVPFSDAIADSTPIMELIRMHIDDDVIESIAAEYRKGRRLFIGTTDLNHMRLRIWNIGAIAASGLPHARDLIHKIILASASIPGIFPPVSIDVAAGGTRYTELHVDGGLSTQVFVYPAATDWHAMLERLEVPAMPNIYVIRNATLTPDRKELKPTLIPIAGRSVTSLIRTQGIGDLYLIYMLTRRDGGNYHLAYVPDAYDDVEPSELFDTAYMQRLFAHGYEQAVNGYPWSNRPPGWMKPFGTEK